MKKIYFFLLSIIAALPFANAVAQDYPGTRYDGTVTITIYGVPTELDGQSIYMVNAADGKTCDFYLHDFKLDGQTSIGSIDVPGVQITENGGAKNYEGAKDGILLDNGNIVANCVLDGTEQADGTLHMNIHVQWVMDPTDPSHNMPVEVTFDGKKVAEAVALEFVDLGLPSGTLWANMNVGATSIEDPGTYVGWGEIYGKNDYSWATYKWCNGTQNIMTKYVIDSTYGEVDNKSVLDADDDLATTVGGTSPSSDQFNELLDKNNCTWTVEIINDRKGARITGNNGNSIFVPAGGFMTGTRLSTDNSACCLWTNELTTSAARYYYNGNCIRIGFTRTNTISTDSRDHNGMGFVPRNYGYNVRAVKAATSGIEDIESTDATVVKVYNVNGLELKQPAKGLNIVVYSNGTTKKVLVK
ncbi:MAG: calycin-like domain-containing protein [Muribaculum sp.]|nr:calycin-like domain-containing protein [Muribaculaceae bacterium]MCM1080550.1 calycin-like domain-containing protein [Muribaculum sp.]